MKRYSSLIWLLLLPLLACLEPGPTPMGPEAGDLDPPDAILIFENAMALISVAHPDFRQDLLHAAKARRLVFAHQIIPPRGAVFLS